MTYPLAGPLHQQIFVVLLKIINLLGRLTIGTDSVRGDRKTFVIDELDDSLFPGLCRCNEWESFDSGGSLQVWLINTKSDAMMNLPVCSV